MNTQAFPTQQQTRPQEELTHVENEQLKWETDGNYTAVIPPLPTNPLARMLRAWLGIGPREDRLFEELQRQQQLIVLLAQQARGMRSDHDAVAGMASQDHQALGDEHGIIVQVNRQTNAISSLLDRLQFYEQNVSLIGRARKSYNQAIQRKLSRLKEEQAAAEAHATGVTLEPETAPSIDEQLNLGEDHDGDGDIPAFVG